MRRERELLRAAFDILRRCETSTQVLEAHCVLARYDDADCDGSCLMDDIATLLDIDRQADPIQTQENATSNA